MGGPRTIYPSIGNLITLSPDDRLGFWLLLWVGFYWSFLGVFEGAVSLGIQAMCDWRKIAHWDGGDLCQHLVHSGISDVKVLVKTCKNLVHS